MIQTNALTVEFALMASVNVKTMKLDFSVKSNQLRMATVILSITPLNTVMMVVTAAKVHASVQTCIHAAICRMTLVLHFPKQSNSPSAREISQTQWEITHLLRHLLL